MSTITNVAPISWSSYVTLPTNATFKEFNVYNYTTDSNSVSFSQTGSWSSGALTSGNTTSYWYGFNTMVNSVSK